MKIIIIKRGEGAEPIALLLAETVGENLLREDFFPLSNSVPRSISKPESNAKSHFADRLPEEGARELLRNSNEQVSRFHYQLVRKRSS
jgi:hypothetical protein